MSLADQVTNLTNDRNNIRTSLINKGITEAASHGFSSFDDDIDRMVKPEGTITVTENGTYDVTEREGIVVNVYTVTPIDSPETEVEQQMLFPHLYISWNSVNNAICYTIQRKTDATAWENIQTTYKNTKYKDLFLNENTRYYYRVFAICDGVEPNGNSLSSNIASAVTQYKAATSTSYFKVNDFCEDVSGGWIIEGYDREGYMPVPETTPRTPTLSTVSSWAGWIEESYTYYESYRARSSWIHTINSIYIDAPGGKPYCSVSFTYYCNNPYISFGVFPVDKSAPPIIIDNDEQSGSVEGKTVRVYIDTPGEYYIGIRQKPVDHDRGYTKLFIKDVCLTKRIWDGYIFDDNISDSEVTDLTGGYSLEDTPSYIPTGVTPTKFELQKSGSLGIDGYKLIMTASQTGVDTYGGIITKKLIPVIGCTKLNYTFYNIKSVNGQYVYFAYYDYNMQRIGKNQVSRQGVSGEFSGSIDLPSELHQYGVVYYIEICFKNMNEFRLINMSIS